MATIIEQAQQAELALPSPTSQGYVFNIENGWAPLIANHSMAKII